MLDVSVLFTRSLSVIHCSQPQNAAPNENFDNPPRLCGYIYIPFLLAYPHFCLVLTSAPHLFHVHVQMTSWFSCPHASALKITPTKIFNLFNTRHAFVSSKWFCPSCTTQKVCLFHFCDLVQVFHPMPQHHPPIKPLPSFMPPLVHQVQTNIPKEFQFAEDVRCWFKDGASLDGPFTSMVSSSMD